MTDFISVKLAASGGEGTITILNTGFAICVAFSILFFIVSVVLFFVFDIKRIFDMKTGRAEKQKIREMEEENALTGRLINPNLKSDNGKNQKGRIKQHSGFSEKLNRIKNNTQAVPGRPNIPGLDSPQYQPQNYQQEAYAPKPLMPAPQPEAPQPQMYASYQHDTEVLSLSLTIRRQRCLHRIIHRRHCLHRIIRRRHCSANSSLLRLSSQLRSSSLRRSLHRPHFSAI